jgi:hypothetical protein
VQGENGAVTSESIGGAANYHFLCDKGIDGCTYGITEAAKKKTLKTRKTVRKHRS